jgi:hypothetical protein
MKDVSNRLLRKFISTIQRFSEVDVYRGIHCACALSNAPRRQYGEVKVQLHALLTLELDRIAWSLSFSGRFSIVITATFHFE